MRTISVLKIVLFVVLTLVCFSATVLSQGKFDRSKEYNLEDFQPVHYNGQIIDVNVAGSYIAIDGVVIDIAKNITMKNGKKYSTRIIDQKERPIKLDSFKRLQRVKIFAYRLPNGSIVGAQIKKMAALPGDRKKGDLTPR